MTGLSSYVLGNKICCLVPVEVLQVKMTTAAKVTQIPFIGGIFTGTIFRKELVHVILGIDINVSHTHKTCFCYFLRVPFNTDGYSPSYLYMAVSPRCRDCGLQNGKMGCKFSYF